MSFRHNCRIFYYYYLLYWIGLDKQTKKQYYRRVVNDVIFSDGLLTFLKLTQTLVLRVFISGR